MGLYGLLGKRWLIPLLVILIIILAVETAVLIIIIDQSLFGGKQVFPGISLFRWVGPGCQTLVWSVEASTSSNRSILFTCPKVSGQVRGALVLSGWSLPLSFPSFEANPYSPRFAVVPTFSLPRGYLTLSLTSQSCFGGAQIIPLKTGQEIGVGGYSSSYNYCAVIDNSVSKVSGFTIDWSLGTPPVFRPAPFVVTVTPSTTTISAGQTANYTITVSSLKGWTGNVSFYGYMGGGVPNRTGGPISFDLIPPTLLLKPDESNHTALSVPTRQCTTAGDYCTPAASYRVYLTAYTNCLVTVPGGWCVDGYSGVNFTVDENVI